MKTKISIAFFSVLIGINSLSAIASQTSLNNITLATIKDISGYYSQSPTVSKVIEFNGYALALWTCGEVWGSSLLKNQNSSWIVLRSGGKGPMDSDFMQAVGVPSNTANLIDQQQNITCGSVGQFTTSQSVSVTCNDLNY